MRRDAAAQVHGSAPIAGLDGDPGILGPDDGVVAQRRDDHRAVPLPEAADGGEVEMVVMVVGDQHRMDRRQILERDARRIDPPGAGETEGARPLGEDRIGEDVEARRLDEKRSRGR